MTLTVADRANSIATFRFIQVRLMEIAAAWTPTTPEMEVKVLFGRHIWDFAQHADLLGKRTFELRQPAHYTLAPVASYTELLQSLAAEETTAVRLSALYDGFLPAIQNRYESYLAETDRLLDAPSVDVITRIITDHSRMRREADALRHELSLKTIEVGQVIARERAHQNIVAARGNA